MASKKEIKKQAEDEKNLFMEEFKNLYVDEVMMELYESEKDNFYKYVDNLVQVKLGNILTMKKEIENNLSNLDKFCGKKKRATSKEPDMEAQIRSDVEKNLKRL